MWQNEENTWLHYVKDIIAADMRSAIFLASYMRKLGISRSYAASLEVIDLQRYRVIKKEKRVRAALIDLVREPFIFFVGKN